MHVKREMFFQITVKKFTKLIKILLVNILQQSTQLMWFNSLWLWRWLPNRLSKHHSLSTTTVLFRTTFTWTIMLNLYMYLAELLIIRGKKVKFHRIFGDKIAEKSVDFTGIFRANLAGKQLVKKWWFCGYFQGKFCKKLIGFVLIRPALLMIF